MTSIYALNSRPVNNDDLQMGSLGSLDVILKNFVPVINDTTDQANASLDKVKSTHGTDTSDLAVYQKDLNGATMVQTAASTLMKKVTDLAQSTLSNIR